MIFEDWWSEERKQVFWANFAVDENLAIETLARDAFLAGMFKDVPQQTVEDGRAKICALYEGCRYRVFREGCPENCGKYTPAP